MSNTQLSIKKRTYILSIAKIWKDNNLELLKNAESKFDIQENLSKRLKISIMYMYNLLEDELGSGI